MVRFRSGNRSVSGLNATSESCGGIICLGSEGGCGVLSREMLEERVEGV